MADDRVREPRPGDRGWAAHERAQRRRYAALSLAEKIAWLEEAQRMALHLNSSRSSRPAE